LKKNSDEQIIKPMIDMLEQQISYMIPEMRYKLALKDHNRLSQIAHSLKSSALQLGLQKVADICLTLETEGRRNFEYPFEQLIFDLEIELRESITELAEYLNKSQQIAS